MVDTLYTVDIQIPFTDTNDNVHYETVWQSPLFDDYPDAHTFDSLNANVKDVLNCFYHVTSPDVFDQWWKERHEGLSFADFCRANGGGDAEWDFFIYISEYKYERS